ncbi:MAG TPA: CPBP family intramembrane metalloprotease [Actinobacteria bacterium]|nr:CAAX amino terminal protease self- immunity [bacterium BMS3Bbin01]HDH25477.1 CPBP family intramembrane metalloprotease [Actinomycetota bacterium]
MPPAEYRWLNGGMAAAAAGRVKEPWSKSAIVVAGPAVLIVMYPIFRLTSRAGDRVEGYLGWAAGLAIYWVIWGMVFPRVMLGWSDLRQLVRPTKAGVRLLLLVALPLVITVAGRVFDPETAYETHTVAAQLIVIATAVGNGFFEEVFWRGIPLRVFPDSRFLGVVWPSIWFGLWHLAPASASADGGALPLVVGAMFLGLYLGFLARTSGSIWWPVFVHTCAGLILVL